MSSTNKTTNYELSQFIGSDKPAWLSDYNGDMGKIDTGIHNAQTTATGADGKADANATSIGTLSNLNTTAKTDLVSAINEANTNAGTAQGTASSANTKAEANATSIGKIVSTLNINTYLAYKYSDITIPTNNASFLSGDTNDNVFIARNQDGTMFKVYGNMVFTPTTTNEVKFRLSNTGIATDTAYTIVGAGIGYQNGSPDMKIGPATLEVNNGYIDVKFKPYGANVQHVVRLMACLYFNGDFGDIQPSN